MKQAAIEDNPPQVVANQVTLLNAQAHTQNATTDTWLANRLPYPTNDAHKYSRGMLVAFVGSKTYPGAAMLASDAALRAGAGYVKVFTAKSAIPLVLAHRPSLVVRGIKTHKKGDYSKARPNRPCAYLAGCGYDASKKTYSKQVLDVLRYAQAPVLVDGGGLYALCSKKARQILVQREHEGYATVITPHASEAARLGKACSISADLPRTQLALSLAKWYRSTVVLKGPTTIVCHKTDCYHMAHGTPALAKAGTGDVLAGIIAALLAQGYDPFVASALGTRLHAQAGCEAAAKKTSICTTAEDVIEMLPQAIQTLAQTAI